MSNKPYTAPNKEIYAWGFGAIACHALIQTFGQAGVIFTVGFGISPVVIGWALMLPRIVDAVLDPYLGHMSDETHTRWGRRKPYLVIGAVVGSLLLAAMWWANPHWSQAAQLWYLAVMGTLFYICYGLYTMSWTAVGYELTDDYHERSRVMAYGSLGLAVVSFGAAWVFRAAQMPSFGGVINGMRAISAGVGVLIVISAFVAAKYCKERFTHTNTQHVPLIPALKSTVGNKPFMILLLIKVSQLLGERLSGALLTYLAIYMACRGDKVLATTITGWGGTIGTVWSFLMVPLIKPLSVKLGKRKALIMGAVIGVVAAVIQPFILRCGHPWLMLVPALFISPLVTLAFTLGNAIVPDICDLDELQTGQRREGLFTSIMAFMAKMEISFCTLASGYLVAFSGLNVKISVQPEHVLNKLFDLAVIPSILFACVTLYLTYKFPMTEESSEEVRRQLEARRMANPQEAGDELVPDPNVESWAQAAHETVTLGDDEAAAAIRR
jgi:GPH family glycoside/pentoside/hexuronide:cation symporter